MASQIPTEIELVFELMPCQAERVAQSPGSQPHACSYFVEWGKYHSFDYASAGPPKAGLNGPAVYAGRAALVPEMLTGCRKAPILAVGINPNLPGWWPNLRPSLNPLFDEYRQYAHYFRYRGTAKPELSEHDYRAFGGGGVNDEPPTATFELNVPKAAGGERVIAMQWRAQKMYLIYQELLDALAKEMGWPAGRLSVGEDLSYANMVACPSARWTTKASNPPDQRLPVMTGKQRDGIVRECFRSRKYFLRQLFQSLPNVILVFSQNTASTFVGELEQRFSAGSPKPTDTIDMLMSKTVILHYGDLPDGTELEAQVIFGPHPTGDPDTWAARKKDVIAQLVTAAQHGRLTFNPSTSRLARPSGSCIFCTGLGIGPCEYRAELKPLDNPPVLTADRISGLAVDKSMQRALLEQFVSGLSVSDPGALWSDDDGHHGGDG